MCGICGFVTKKTISRSEFEIMNNKLIHRGPDDAGIEIAEERRGYIVGLGHRRLSIMDLSNLGHQPMCSPDGRITVVFNGEIYNFQELKKELTGYPFKSNCDTEVIIASYLKWGEEERWIKRLDGMFAIALYDREKHKLLLIRDRIGKKPLYYWMDGKNIVFASELKSIIYFPGFVKEINRSVLHRYLHQSYISAPDTIFNDVYQLEPGTIGTYEEGKFSIKKYWKIRTEYKKGIENQIQSYAKAKKGLKDIIIKAVEKRMVADVPIGTFLSGGYDSSLVTAIAQSISSTPVNTFSIGVNDEKLNEAHFAKEIAKYLGTNHTELYISEKDMLGLVDSIPVYFDEPFADSSQIPTMLVSELARRDVAVALSGDGGDEFFCGYEGYANAHKAQIFDIPGSILHSIGSLEIKGVKIEDIYPTKIKVVSDNRDIRYKTQIISKHYVDVTRNMLLDDFKYQSAKYNENKYNVKDWQIRKMLLDMDTYLPMDILVKVDRASMKYSLENRCPLLDKDVMQYSFCIPHRFKFYKGDKKHILKDIAYDYIPRKMLERPKQGFSIPINKWLMGPLKDRLLDYSEESYLKKQGIFNVKFTHELVHNYLLTGDMGPATGKNYSKICWTFFVFQQWYQCYMT